MNYVWVLVFLILVQSSLCGGWIDKRRVLLHLCFEEEGMEVESLQMHFIDSQICFQYYRDPIP